MAHEIETGTESVPALYYDAYKYAKVPNEACSMGSPSGTQYPNRTLGGATVGVSRGRDASHHTVLEKYGWRDPTTYWGYRYVLAGRKVIGNRPIVANSSYVYGNTCPLSVTKSLPTGVNLITYRPSFADLQAQAVTAALADLGAAEAELGVELVEAHKTAAFVGENLQALWRSARALRKGQVPKSWRKAWAEWKGDIPRKFDTVFCQKWMEYRYAWSPMLMGVNDAIFLLDKVNQHPMISTVRKRAESVTSSETTANTSHGGYYPLPCTVKTTLSETKSVYVVLSFVPRADGSLVTANQAGVLDLASVVWESIPFSWMADWVLAVGDYLNAQQAKRLYALQGGTATHRHEWLTVKEYTWTAPSGGVVCVPPDVNKVEAGGSTFNRVVNPSLDLSLSWGKGLNCFRALDAISLLYGLFKGKSVMGLRV